MEKTTQWGS